MSTLQYRYVRKVKVNSSGVEFKEFEPRLKHGRFQYISRLHLPDLNRFKPMVRGMNRIKGIIPFGFIDHVIFEESSMFDAKPHASICLITIPKYVVFSII